MQHKYVLKNEKIIYICYLNLLTLFICSGSAISCSKNSSFGVIMNPNLE